MPSTLLILEDLEDLEDLVPLEVLEELKVLDGGPLVCLRPDVLVLPNLRLKLVTVVLSLLLSKRTLLVPRLLKLPDLLNFRKLLKLPP